MQRAGSLLSNIARSIAREFPRLSRWFSRVFSGEINNNQPKPPSVPLHGRDDVHAFEVVSAPNEAEQPPQVQSTQPTVEVAARLPQQQNQPEVKVAAVQPPPPKTEAVVQQLSPSQPPIPQPPLPQRPTPPPRPQLPISQPSSLRPPALPARKPPLSPLPSVPADAKPPALPDSQTLPSSPLVQPPMATTASPSSVTPGDTAIADGLKSFFGRETIKCARNVLREHQNAPALLDADYAEAQRLLAADKLLQEELIQALVGGTLDAEDIKQITNTINNIDRNIQTSSARMQKLKEERQQSEGSLYQQYFVYLDGIVKFYRKRFPDSVPPGDLSLDELMLLVDVFDSLTEKNLLNDQRVLALFYTLSTNVGKGNNNLMFLTILDAFAHQSTGILEENVDEFLAGRGDVKLLNVHPDLQYAMVIGDGNCMFSSVLFHLGGDDFKRLGIDGTPPGLRERLGAYMRENLTEEDKGFLYDVDIDEYLKRFERNSTVFVDDLDIKMLMQMLERPIAIILPDGTMSIKNCEMVEQILAKHPTAVPIFVYFDNAHYSALTLKVDRSPQEVLRNILENSKQKNEARKVAESPRQLASAAVSTQQPQTQSAESQTSPQVVSEFAPMHPPAPQPPPLPDPATIKVHEDLDCKEAWKAPNDDSRASCMYRAVLDYCGLLVPSYILRETLAGYIERERQTTEGIPTHEWTTYKNMDAYLAAVRNPKVPADDVDILLLMDMIKRPIVIVGSDGLVKNADRVAMKQAEFASVTGSLPEPIFLCRYEDPNLQDRGHYWVLKIKPDSKARPNDILKDLLARNTAVAKPDQAQHVETYPPPQV